MTVILIFQILKRLSDFFLYLLYILFSWDLWLKYERVYASKRVIVCVLPASIFAIGWILLHWNVHGTQVEVFQSLVINV